MNPNIIMHAKPFWADQTDQEKSFKSDLDNLQH